MITNKIEKNRLSYSYKKGLLKSRINPLATPRRLALPALLVGIILASAGTNGPVWTTAVGQASDEPL